MRLIDADALIEYICLRQKTDTIPKEDAEAVKHFVEHYAPTIDAIPVVRCKDCTNDIWAGTCNPFIYCSTWCRLMPEDGCCYMGKKRDKEE